MEQVNEPELNNLKKHKGSQCSKSGNDYEKQIYRVVNKCSLNGKPFNTQKEDELAGSSSKNDIVCNFIDEKDIGIEGKIYTTPDWMQCSIQFDTTKNSWIPSKKSKNPPECSVIFTELINSLDLYNGDIPPFIEKSITHEEWIKIKKETNKWDDKYINIPDDTITRLYKAKGCNYIQISDGYGLYHLGIDVCEFGVPLFNIEQRLRIRTKIHKTKNKNGFCSLSVTASCCPKNIKNLIPSKYSFDNKSMLPSILLWQDNKFNQ